MLRPEFDRLEGRTLLAVTKIEFLSTAGRVLADYAAVTDDQNVLVRITTKGMRGKVGKIELFEDDSPFGEDYIGPLRFVVPRNSDQVTLRFNASYVDDGFGLFGDPEFRFWASTSSSETVHSQHLTVRRRNASAPDPNDAIGEAADLGAMTFERIVNGSISSARDVDMYRFSVDAGQWIAFDVDIADNARLDSVVRVFDSAGKQLTWNDNAGTLTDTMAVESAKRDKEIYGTFSDSIYEKSAFAHHVFKEKGTYYVAVSGAGNARYDPKTGGGDANGKTGRYTLTLTPLTRMVSNRAASGQVTGKLMLPNPEDEPWRNTEIDVTLKRYKDQGSAIVKNLFTWILVHGRVDRAESWAGTDRLVSRHLSIAPDQVLTLDWRDGAADNDGDSGLQGSAWIPLVGQWAQSFLTRHGIATNNVGLIGHSWGTYVSYEIARAGAEAGRGSTRGIVALDPAYGGDGAGFLGLQYAASSVNFSRHFKNSWAIYGNGQYGSAELAGTAREAFAVNYRARPTFLGAHTAPRMVFRDLLKVNNAQRAKAPAKYKLFTLENLLRPARRPWRPNVYVAKNRTGSGSLEAPRRVFEGIFVVDYSATQRWELRDIQYKRT